jgi:hypothetical protein
MAILAIQWPHYAPFLDPPVTCQPDLRNCHGIDLCQGVAKWQVSTRVWKPMAKDNDQQTTEGSNSLGYSLILALWRLSGTSATATIDLIPLGLPIMASFWTTLWLLVWMTCNYYVHTSFNLLHATVNTNKPGTEHFNLGPHLLDNRC